MRCAWAVGSFLLAMRLMNTASRATARKPLNSDNVLVPNEHQLHRRPPFCAVGRSWVQLACRTMQHGLTSAGVSSA